MTKKKTLTEEMRDNINIISETEELNEYALPVTEIIEYEDMTDKQKQIVDAGDTCAGYIPDLKGEDLKKWLHEQIEKA